ncbi:MAG: MCE family protein [Nocardioides sp.]|nr:MCE family protein [Nocardioides sp.]
MSLLSRNVRALGIVFLALLVLSVYLTYAVFTKKFTDYERVGLETSSIGLQLPMRADVKVRGKIVGEVLDLDATAGGARLTLGLFPAEIETIPANVTASIVPKTLFGEKYVSLLVPDQPDGTAIEAGDTITQTRVSTEVEKVLSDLYPLLQTVQPAKINMTLNAIATALEGRGDQIGENLETVDEYLKRLNPQIPGLVEDLRLTTQVSTTYQDILPELGDILQDTITTTGTLEDRSAKLNSLLKDVTAFSGTTQTFLEDNGQNLITLGEVSEAQLDVLARYSSEFPCLLQGVENAGKRQAEAFRNFTLHIVLETLPNQPRPYTAADTPMIGDDRGPDCVNLPNPSGSQANPVRQQPDFNDGVDSPTGKGTSRAPTDYVRNDLGYAGTPQEADVLKTLLAPGLGRSATEVPDLGVLLVGPMARGATVSIG